MQAAPLSSSSLSSSSPHSHHAWKKQIVLRRKVRNYDDRDAEPEQQQHRSFGIQKPTTIAVAAFFVLGIGSRKQRQVVRITRFQSRLTPTVSFIDLEERLETSKNSKVKEVKEDRQHEEPKADKQHEEPKTAKKEKGAKEEAAPAPQVAQDKPSKVFKAGHLRRALDEGAEAVKITLRSMKKLAASMDGVDSTQWEKLLDLAALEVRKEAAAQVAMDILATFQLKEGGYISYFKQQLVLHQMERRQCLKKMLKQTKNKFVKEKAPELRRVVIDGEENEGKLGFELVSKQSPAIYPGDIGILVPSASTDEETVDWALRDFWMVRLEPVNEDDYTEELMEEFTEDDDDEVKGESTNRLISADLIPHISRTSAGGQSMPEPPFRKLFRLFTLPTLPYERRVAAIRSICRLNSAMPGSVSSRMRRIILAPPQQAKEAADEKLEELPARWNSSLTCDKFRDLLTEWCPEAQDLKISEQQLQVVMSALKQPLSIIQGPPGTGKSHVASIIIAVMVAVSKIRDREDNAAERVLVVAESNAAVDNLYRAAKRLGVHGIRLGVGSARDIVWMRNTYSSLPAKEQLQLDLQSAEAVFTTCLSSARAALSQSGKFHRVIVDEAAQALEASVLIPLSLGCKQLVLIGDHKQLPPVVTSIAAKNRGLGKSLFERLIASEVALPLFLAEQRRMHSSIAEFPSNHFYEGRLTNAIGDDSRPPVPGFPWPLPEVDCRVCFVDIGKEHGGERMEPSFSPSRPVEAELVAEVVARIHGEAELSLEKVCVLTPYRGQRTVLQRELNHRGLFNLVPKTVDSYQGMELDLVIISTTRIGKSIGFLKDEQRTNVMLTRARRGLIVFGHGESLRRSDTIWSAWLQWVEKKGCVLKIEDLISDERWA